MNPDALFYFFFEQKNHHAMVWKAQTLMTNKLTLMIVRDNKLRHQY